MPLRIKVSPGAITALAAAAIAFAMVIWMVDAGTRPASVYADAWPREPAHVSSSLAR